MALRFSLETHLRLETRHGKFSAEKNLEPQSQRKEGGEDSVGTGTRLLGSRKGLKHDISMEDGEDLH